MAIIRLTNPAADHILYIRVRARGLGLLNSPSRRQTLPMGERSIYTKPPAAIITPLGGDVNLSFALEQKESSKLKKPIRSIGYSSSDKRAASPPHLRPNLLISLEKYFDYSRGHLTSCYIRENFSQPFQTLTAESSHQKF